MAIDLVRGRYELLELIGVGGMGEVFRSHDRISGEIVALKRALQMPTLGLNRTHPLYSQTHFEITSPLTAQRDGMTISSAGPRNLLALASEFRVLSSLRHPNIVSVLDYGFQGNGLPFFTMELLSSAQTIVDAAKGQPLQLQLDLLFQTLQALSYLHRHGVIHRDLKASNILVTNSQVTVLDFGVSGLPKDTVAGTPGFIAPEVLLGAPPSPASDFYAIAGIAYEMLTGKSFAQSRRRRNAPDTTPLEATGAVGEIIQRLLSEDPIQRGYTDATILLADLARAAGLELPHESSAHRESYLKAAPMTDRNHELAQLLIALQQTATGTGSGWLVGGEGGVGKSRLLDELRSRAHIEGFLVLRGRAEEAGAPYSIFRDSVLRLILLVDITDEEAAVLKTLFPEIERILGREVSNIHAFDPQVLSERLLEVIVDLFARHPDPTLLEIEDCHVAGESLKLLLRLAQLATTRNLLVVASFRDNESPQLASQCKGMHLLHVPRFGPPDVRQLAISMLGEAMGNNPTLLSFLERETEGNAFFLVETVRQLAEDSGRLDRVSPAMLPERVFSGGMKAYVQHRLERLPFWTQRSIQLVAVLGREIDLDVLRAADPTADLDQLLIVCGDAAILEGHGYGWRFSHNKLREAILEELDPAMRSELSLRAASAIEQVHGAAPAFIHAQALLWKQAGIPSKAAEYLLAAAMQMLSAGVPERAADLASDAARQLGVDIPEDPAGQGAAIGAEMRTIGVALDGRSPASLIHLPALREDRIARIIQILQLIGPAAHISQKPELFALCVLKSFALTLEHGVGSDAPSVIAMYAAVVRSMTGDVRLAHDFSRLAIDLDHRLHHSLSSPVAFIHGWFINHWLHPLRTNIQLARDGAQAGLEGDDLLYGCFNAAAIVMYLSLTGPSLDQIVKAAEEQLERTQRRVLVSAFHCMLERQLSLALMGRTRHRLSLTDDTFDEDRDLASIFATSNYNQMGYFYVAKMRLNYYYANYETAFYYSEKALPLLVAFQGQVVEWDFAFYRALAALGCALEVDAAERGSLLAVADDLLQRFSAWAILNPHTFAHKRDLIHAELCRHRTSTAAAAKTYEVAIASATASGFLHDLALAQERAALFFAASQQPRLANSYARAALTAYTNWQAWAKSMHINETLLAPGGAASHSTSTESFTTH
jgi:serine/threonine protein kinase